jgi:hypothetical protein
MSNHRSPVRTGLPHGVALLVVLALTAAVAACAGAAPPSPSPDPTIRPTPTPITAPATTPAEAAALVIATNPIFQGAIQLSPDMIGASKYWVATPTATGHTIEMTVGWGDCPAGCIDKHVWTFDVASDGTVKLVSESGPEVPIDLPG